MYEFVKTEVQDPLRNKAKVGDKAYRFMVHSGGWQGRPSPFISCEVTSVTATEIGVEAGDGHEVHYYKNGLRVTSIFHVLASVLYMATLELDEYVAKMVATVANHRLKTVLLLYLRNSEVIDRSSLAELEAAARALGWVPKEEST